MRESKSLMKNDDYLDTGAWIGRHQAFAVIAGKCTIAQAVALKELKEARAFEPLGLTWDEFCKQRLAISRSYLHRLITELNITGV